MKQILISMLLLCTITTNVGAQEIYNEVKRIMQNQEVIKCDSKKPIEERKIATFKYDAIYYILVKATDNHVSTYELGKQTSAMIDFVNIYIKSLSAEKKKAQRDIIKSKFKKATIENALFNDMDKEIVYAYVDNENFITQFSLDTNWVKALEEIRTSN